MTDSKQDQLAALAWKGPWKCKKCGNGPFEGIVLETAKKEGWHFTFFVGPTKKCTGKLIPFERRALFADGSRLPNERLEKLANEMRAVAARLDSYKLYGLSSELRNMANKQDALLSEARASAGTEGPLMQWVAVTKSLGPFGIWEPVRLVSIGESMVFAAFVEDEKAWYANGKKCYPTHWLNAWEDLPLPPASVQSMVNAARVEGEKK